MGRSVSYPSGAVVAFSSIDTEDEFEFEDAVEDFQEQVLDMFPSTHAENGWLGREDRILVANSHCHFGVSEYCGLVAYWVVPRGDAEHPELAERWFNQIARRFQRRFETLNKIGTASNGESFFQEIAA